MPSWQNYMRRALSPRKSLWPPNAAFSVSERTLPEHRGRSRRWIIRATGSIGRYAVAEALRQGHTLRALVRDQARAARVLPGAVDLGTGAEFGGWR
ncbi:NmrA family NAD(P)-binding protein [Arthrobacter sp. W4I7]|uniref:NmrA family NAD(P)-binding protein n=1 Tax=Arthrobacter sp. W4I7 TaxID=3042296 RepID=UPI00277D3222|nr:NmrA family NAD(P)-binding protein [Arthrobacter sp. W4I7]MDQ0691007.1 hypothetical protein [Arthrobacter sp. W4I7]